jgi:DNA-binding NarL/FixJ family response regulator
MSIDVCLVENQALVREGLESLLRLTPDIRVVARAADGEEGLVAIAASAPHVVLLDLRMPKLDGLGLLARLAEAREPRPAVIILTTFDDDASILQGLRLGARGYLLKDVSFARLTEAIRTVASGGTLVSPVVTERLLKGLPAAAPDPDAPRAEPLTPREREVLRLMSGGFSNAEIAGALDLTEGTVKNHVSNVLSKLGVRDRVRAILKGVELGWV